MTTSRRSELPPFRRPDRGPTSGDLDDRERFSKLVASSLAEVRASAEKWRTGLAALVSLIVGGLLIKGPGDAHKLTTQWRLIVSILLIGGLGFAIFGLWRALEAAAGTPKAQHYDDLVETYGSVLVYEVAAARRAAEKLGDARRTLQWSLILLSAGVLAWWWSGEEPTDPAVTVTVVDGESYCGKLLSADARTFRVRVTGESRPRSIAFDDVTNVAVGEECN